MPSSGKSTIATLADALGGAFSHAVRKKFNGYVEGCSEEQKQELAGTAEGLKAQLPDSYGDPDTQTGPSLAADSVTSVMNSNPFERGLARGRIAGWVIICQAKKLGG